MELPQLIDALADPAAYPYPVDRVDVRQTHISVVFLAGPFVYKVKKPVAPGFLDFSTLDKRRHICHEEVRLNRRLAPDVYLGVVPVVPTPAGTRFEGDGEAVEWAVKMRRLPDGVTLLDRLRRGEVDAPLVEALARRVAEFHRSAEATVRTAARGRFDAVARAVGDVLDRAEPHLGGLLGRDVFARIRGLIDDHLTRLRTLIDARADRGMTRDCHGDLHLDHVYSFPEQAPPADLVIIDCLEFNEDLRAIDPVADMAFIVMDLAFRGRRDLARAFADAYFRAAGDEEGRGLLPLYSAYRAAVRGMVEGLLTDEAEVPDAEREAARTSARGHWLLALAELEAPGRRPCVVLVGGLPGTGKSTLARALAESAGFDWVRSDAIRKELAGLPANEPTPSHLRETLYSSEETDRVYAECRTRAERLLTEGRRVLVDATFREERHRRAFLDVAVRCGVPATVLVCRADPETTRARLDARRGDASDADWAFYLRAAAGWDEPGEDVARVLVPISTAGTSEQALALARDALRELGLHDGQLLATTPRPVRPGSAPT